MSTHRTFLQRLKLAAGLVTGQKASLAALDRFFPDPEGYDMMMGEHLVAPYNNSAWVQRAIKLVSGPISAVPVCVDAAAQPGQGRLATRSTWRPSGTRRAREGAVPQDLAAFLENPAVGMTWSDFIEASVGWMKMQECFWLLDDSYLAPFPKAGGVQRSPIIVARPDRMRRIPMWGDPVQNWEFITQDGKRFLLAPEQVIQIRFWNPYDQWRSVGEFPSAKVAAEADHLQGKFAANVARNNGDQGMYVAANGILNDDQRAQIEASLREKRRKALRGEFSVAFFSGPDVKIQDPKVQALDAGFIGQRLENRHEIALAFGVPPSLFDIKASYSVGAASDRYALIEQTCIPNAAKIEHALNQVLRLRGSTARLSFDWDEHPVMQSVRRERLDAGLKLWQSGLSWQAVDEYLRLGLPEFEGKEQAYLPLSIQTVQDATTAPAPTEDTTYAEGEPAAPEPPGEGGTEGGSDDPIEAMMLALRCGCHQNHTAAFQRGRPAKELNLWKAHVAARKPIAKLYHAKFSKVLFAARAEVLAKIEALGKASASASGSGVHRTAASDLNFDPHKFRDRLFTAFRGAAEHALGKAGQELYSELGKDDPFTMAPAAAHRFIAQRENKLSEVSEEVHATVMSRISEGLDAGDTAKQLADRLRAGFNDIDRGRGMTIAITETNSAYGTARHAAMKSAGISHKEWLTSGNANVRPTHQEANHQVVGIDEPFEVGGEKLMFPGDPDGSPENVINCHCIQLARQGQPEE